MKTTFRARHIASKLQTPFTAELPDTALRQDTQSWRAAPNLLLTQSN